MISWTKIFFHVFSYYPEVCVWLWPAPGRLFSAAAWSSGPVGTPSPSAAAPPTTYRGQHKHKLYKNRDIHIFIHLFNFDVFLELCTGWFPVSASRAVRSGDDASADAPEGGRTAARWRRCCGRSSSPNRQCEGLKREQTPPPLHPLRLPSLLPHTRMTDRSGSVVLRKETTDSGANHS